ncbi:excinuclease ABC subunit UvrC [Gammaproteobacteria bacterium]|nr:excinuclease ABC subunit UvrC [Gammaproteobacteria bacterium]
MRFKELIDGLDEKPGIYFMLGQSSNYLYIGKAKNLKKRLVQYFARPVKHRRTQKMLSHVADLQVMLTHSEASALVLESEMIKKHQPQYNILLKDDKSHPYLQLSEHKFPAIRVVRYKTGKAPSKAKLFGPYPHQDRVKTMQDWILRIFNLRNCSDHFFASRSRPCIQYEIAKCSAPCVDLVSKRLYQRDVQAATDLLSGKGYKTRQQLMEKMHSYSATEDYERAAACRDALKTFASSENKRATDKLTHVFYYEEVGDMLHISVAQFLGEQIEDIQHDLIEMQSKCALDDWLVSYMCQYYDAYHTQPDQVLLRDNVDPLVLAELGQIQAHIMQINARHQVLVEVIAANMQQYRAKKTVGSLDWSGFWQELSNYMGETMTEMVCFDVSHHSGQHTYASCVVASALGLDRNRFRLYKLEANGDDCLALQMALKKWQQRNEPLSSRLIIIDGGKGQINAASTLLDASLPLISIAKGVAREWGKERFYRRIEQEISVFSWPKSLKRTILFLRDQAHDHAISAHRKASRKAAFKSQLDDIGGLGPLKKKQLLGYFGGLDGVKQATVAGLEKVPQIGPKLAKRIYDALKL